MKKYILTLTTFLLLGLISIMPKDVHAYSISPLRQDITLAIGQRQFASVNFTNQESQPIEVKLGVYAYDAKNEEIIGDSKKIFLKLDTDTITIKPKSTLEIRYEIFPISNIEEGTYSNIVTLTPITEASNLTLKNSIAQLVTLHIVTPENDIKGIKTTNYNVSLDVIDKGIPFLKPAKLKYTIQNNSNYIMTPEGGITIISNNSGSAPTSFTINPESRNLYPGESIEKDIEVNTFYISDLIFNRSVIAHFYNGLDSQPKDITTSIGSYKIEIIFVVAILIGSMILGKSLREDNRKKSKES